MKFRQLHVFCTEQLLADSKKPAIISSNFFLENFYKVWNHLIPRIPRQIASYMQSKRYSSYEDIVPRFFETRSSTPSIRKIRKFNNNNNNNNDSQNSNDRKIFLSRNSMHVRRNGALRNIIPPSLSQAFQQASSVHRLDKFRSDSFQYWPFDVHFEDWLSIGYEIDSTAPGCRSREWRDTRAGCPWREGRGRASCVQMASIQRERR